MMTAIADGASEAPEEPGIDAALVQTSRSEIAASREALEIARQAQEPRERKGKRRKTRRHR
ncbi:MAG: hypothetical protein R3C68_04610 [Myxococcota bacterium]